MVPIDIVLPGAKQCLHRRWSLVLTRCYAICTPVGETGSQDILSLFLCSLAPVKANNYNFHQTFHTLYDDQDQEETTMESQIIYTDNSNTHA